MTSRPGRGFHLGKMDKRIRIDKAVETQSDSGQPVIEWKAFLEREPACFIPTGGQESLRGRQLEAGTKAIFIVRYKHGYQPTMSIVLDGDCQDTRYGITYINPVEGDSRYLELICKS